MDPRTTSAGETEGQPVITRILERFGLPAGAQRVFGDPVERDGVTVIPVAWAGWGAGGGEGQSGATDGAEPQPASGDEAESKQTGSGGGGGALIKPVGYIEIAAGRARFRRTEVVPMRLVVLIIASAVAFRIVAMEIMARSC